MPTDRDPAPDPADCSWPASAAVRHRASPSRRVARRVAHAALALGLVALVSGCLPIGARVSNMYAQAPAAPSVAR